MKTDRPALDETSLRRRAGDFLLRHRPAIRWMAGLLLLVALVVLVRREGGLLQRLRDVSPASIAALTLLVTANIFLISVRMAVIAAGFSTVRVSTLSWFRVVSQGQLLNHLMPQLGNVHRAVWMERRFGFRYGDYAKTLLTFVWADIVFGLMSATVAYALIPTKTDQVKVLAVLAMALAGTLMLPSIAARLGASLSGRFGKWSERLTDFTASVRRVVLQRGLLLRLCALSVATVVVHVAALAAAFSALGEIPPVSALVLLQVALRVTNVISLTPGNLGISEALYGAAAVFGGFPVDQALAAALLMRATGLVTILVLGLATLDFKELRRRAADEALQTTPEPRKD